MATVVVGCMCVQSTMVSIMQIYPEGDLFPEAISMVSNICYNGNHTNWVQSFAKV